jgi:hypothetical protein
MSALNIWAPEADGASGATGRGYLYTPKQFVA